MLIAPNSTVALNGNATLVGSLRADRLTLNGGSSIRDATSVSSMPMRGPR